MRNVIALFLGIWLSFFAAAVFAAQPSTGVGFQGKCFPTASQALESFQLGFPEVQNGFITRLNSSSVAGNILTYSVNISNLSAGTSRTVTGNFVLSSCSSVTSYMANNMAGLLYAALLAFFGAFFLRKAFRKFSQFAGGFASDF